MVDDAVEPVRPVAGDPVHHIAAIACAERTGALAVNLTIHLKRRCIAQLQILQWLAAPVLIDRVHELLPVAGTAMEIDGYHCIALGRHDFRVPATGPAVAKTALRTTVDQKCHRQLVGRAFWFDNLTPDLISIRAGKTEPLNTNRIDRSHFTAIDIGQLPDAAIRLAAI